LAYVGAALALAAAAAAPATASTTAAPRCVKAPRPPVKPDGGQKPPKAKLDPKRTYDLTFLTNCGAFTVRLDVRRAPNTTASFVSLARKGFFNRTVFHRIIPGFVVQGGDPTGTGTGGPGYSTVDRPPRPARYTKYTVATAKAANEAPGTSGSQFFVVTAADAQLPAEYALLGRVTSGAGVVSKIAAVKTDPSTEKPLKPVTIHTIKVTEK
jgi:cyclophilin family peptidyl-prolyl cis-trans isomerase